MNILVTGGAGYIGSHTVLSLLDKGLTGSKKIIPKKANFYNCDIANKSKVARIIR